MAWNTHPEHVGGSRPINQPKGGRKKKTSLSLSLSCPRCPRSVPGLSPVCPRYLYVTTIGRFLFDNNGLRIQLLELSPRPRRLPVTRTLFCFGGSTSSRPVARAAHCGPAAAWQRSGSDAAIHQLHPLCVLVLPVQLQRESVSLPHHHPAHRSALGLAGPACNACPPATQRWASGAYRWLMARWTKPGTRQGAACWDRCAYGTAWRCGRGTTSPPLRKRSR